MSPGVSGLVRMSSPLGVLSSIGQKGTPASLPLREVTSSISPLPSSFRLDKEDHVSPKRARLNLASPGAKVGVPAELPQKSGMYTLPYIQFSLLLCLINASPGI